MVIQHDPKTQCCIGTNYLSSVQRNGNWFWPQVISPQSCFSSKCCFTNMFHIGLIGTGMLLKTKRSHSGHKFLSWYTCMQQLGQKSWLLLCLSSMEICFVKRNKMWTPWNQQYPPNKMTFFWNVSSMTIHHIQIIKKTCKNNWWIFFSFNKD